MKGGLLDLDDFLGTKGVIEWQEVGVELSCMSSVLLVAGKSDWELEAKRLKERESEVGIGNTRLGKQSTKSEEWEIDWKGKMCSWKTKSLETKNS